MPFLSPSKCNCWSDFMYSGARGTITRVVIPNLLKITLFIGAQGIAVTINWIVIKYNYNY